MKLHQSIAVGLALMAGVAADGCFAQSATDQTQSMAGRASACRGTARTLDPLAGHDSDLDGRPDRGPPSLITYAVPQVYGFVPARFLRGEPSSRSHVRAHCPRRGRSVHRLRGCPAKGDLGTRQS